MQALGVNDLFNESTCKLDAMTSAAGTFVSAMIHEAVVIVDEAGTEAAAATVAVCCQESCMMGPPPAVFYANHPFIYYIKHNISDLILFVGDYHGE
jgi:serpin B/serpin B11/12